MRNDHITVKKMNVTNCGAEIKRKWQRKLYIEQPYEDNYVDETFLHNLQTNCNYYICDLDKFI